MDNKAVPTTFCCGVARGLECMATQTILVIEDDSAIRRGIVDALKVSGYATVEATDGEAGLAAASNGALSGASRIDLVLLDVLLPKLDGFTVLSQLRQRKCRT